MPYYLGGYIETYRNMWGLGSRVSQTLGVTKIRKIVFWGVYIWLQCLRQKTNLGAVLGLRGMGLQFKDLGLRCSGFLVWRLGSGVLGLGFRF